MTVCVCILSPTRARAQGELPQTRSKGVWPTSAQQATPVGDRKAFTVLAAAVFKIGADTSITLGESHDDVNSDVSDRYTKNTTTLAVSRVF